MIVPYNCSPLALRPLGCTHVITPVVPTKTATTLIHGTTTLKLFIHIGVVMYPSLFSSNRTHLNLLKLTAQIQLAPPYNHLKKKKKQLKGQNNSRLDSPKKKKKNSRLRPNYNNK